MEITQMIEEISRILPLCKRELHEILHFDYFTSDWILDDSQIERIKKLYLLCDEIECRLRGELAHWWFFGKTNKFLNERTLFSRFCDDDLNHAEIIIIILKFELSQHPTPPPKLRP